MKMVCVLFKKVPLGTHYTRGAYSWVKESIARRHIAQGYGYEYDPRAKKLVSGSPYSVVLENMSEKSKKKNGGRISRRKFTKPD